MHVKRYVVYPIRYRVAQVEVALRFSTKYAETSSRYPHERVGERLDEGCDGKNAGVANMLMFLSSETQKGLDL